MAAGKPLLLARTGFRPGLPAGNPVAAPPRAMPGFQPGQGSRRGGDWRLAVRTSTRMKVHDGEVGIDAGLVRRLVAVQFPQLAGLPVSAVRSTGTVNAIYRLDDDLCARLPRVRRYTSDLVDELRWLPWLAPHLSLPGDEPGGSSRWRSARSMRSSPTSVHEFPPQRSGRLGCGSVGTMPIMSLVMAHRSWSRQAPSMNSSSGE